MSDAPKQKGWPWWAVSAAPRLPWSTPIGAEEKEMKTRETPRPPQSPRQGKETRETPCTQISEKDVTAQGESRQRRLAPTPAAALLFAERPKFLRWLERLGASAADAEEVHSDALLRAQIYHCPASVAPEAAAWRHVRLARLDHIRSQQRRTLTPATLLELEQTGQDRMATPEDHLLAAQHLADVQARARQKVTGRPSVARALDQLLGLDDRHASEGVRLANALGVRSNWASKLRGLARKALAEALVEACAE